VTPVGRPVGAATAADDPPPSVGNPNWAEAEAARASTARERRRGRMRELGEGRKK
jgi:hypothetical protein